ncbi:MAG: hypothetical protein SV775_13920 [Thermodesulfobacteriota bacterium]|nr:hypothetical protein [Thermodesulfobacteriota bacterium]
MLKFRESHISAHHNYLVNDMLAAGFLLGDPDSPKTFYFLSDIVPPGESTPRISARAFDEHGLLLFELTSNVMGKNPCECASQSIPGGVRILDSSGKALLEVRTEEFTNGYLTRLKARLFDEHGNLRIGDQGESIQVYGEADMAYISPPPAGGTEGNADHEQRR